MPYIHKGCGGVIGLISRRCKKCKRKWPISAWFLYPPPKDMIFATRLGKIPAGKIPRMEKGKTPYARWADNIPGAGIIASRLPRWPRWARILLFVGILIAILFIARYIRG